MRTRVHAHLVLALVFAAGLAGCGGTGTAGQGTRPRSSADRIVAADIEPLSQFSAYEVIERLRPRWFQTRTRQEPMLHVDGNVRAEGLDLLHSLRAGDVEEIQYMSASDATTRFGTGYYNGLILVTTKH